MIETAAGGCLIRHGSAEPTIAATGISVSLIDNLRLMPGSVFLNEQSRCPLQTLQSVYVQPFQRQSSQT